MRNVTLILDDGTRFRGQSFGYEKPVAGEVVFNTAMTGYPESLTDPSYAGQLMTLTYPLVGNYGVPPFTRGADGIPDYMEGAHIYAEAIIVSDYSENFSHWNAAESLGDWLKREQIPGITGIDTRALTKALREHGVMMGRIVFDDDAIDNGQLTIDNYGDINYVDRVSCKEIIVYNGNESRKFSIDTPKEELNCQLSIVTRGLRRESQYPPLPHPQRRGSHPRALGLRLQRPAVRRPLHLQRTRRPGHVRRGGAEYPPCDAE